MGSEQLNKSVVISLLVPALNILRAMEIGLQEHECVYQSRVSEATRNLCKLIELSK